MKHDQSLHPSTSLWQTALVAALAGGMAEIIWVSLYAAFTPLTAASVAREVTASLLPAYAAGITGAWLGILIHVLLSVVLGFAFAYTLWRPFAYSRGGLVTLALSLTALGLVWAINFFLVLPVVNPVFVTLMPYTVTFASKMLFALAMGATLVWPDVRMIARHPGSPVQLAG